MLSQAFVAMSQIAKDKQEKRLRYEPMVKTIRRRQARRIRVETFGIMASIARKQ